MTPYSVQPKDRIFVKVYGCLSSAKIVGRNIRKRIIKNLSSKYNQDLIAKKSAVDALKTTSKIQKAAEGTGDLIRNKIADNKSQKCHQRTIQKQMRRFLEKDICLQDEERKL